jgi:hypothetical protein
MDLKKELELEYKKYREKIKKHRKEIENAKDDLVLDDKELELTEEFYQKIGKILEKQKKSE